MNNNKRILKNSILIITLNLLIILPYFSCNKSIDTSSPCPYVTNEVIDIDPRDTSFIPCHSPFDSLKFVNNLGDSGYIIGPPYITSNYKPIGDSTIPYGCKEKYFYLEYRRFDLASPTQNLMTTCIIDREFLTSKSQRVWFQINNLNIAIESYILNNDSNYKENIHMNGVPFSCLGIKNYQTDSIIFYYNKNVGILQFTEPNGTCWKRFF